MKIAIFADNFYPELSGISDTIIATSKELVKLGHELDIFVPRYSAKDYTTGKVAKQELDLGPKVTIHRLFSIPFPTTTNQGRFVFPNFFKGLFGGKKYDLVHSHSFFGPGLSAIALARHQKIPLIGTNHTIVEAFSPIQVDWVKQALAKYVVWYFNHCDQITTPSDFMLQDMKQKGLRCPITVLSNPIERGFFCADSNKPELKKKLGMSSFSFLYVGRIAPEKNPIILIKAFNSFAQNHPDCDLVFVGQGSLRAKLEKMAREMNRSKQIKFLGPYMGENKQSLYDAFGAADAFVIPSISETQSMTTLQAMAAGLPTIAARFGALPGLVGPDKGVIFDPFDQEGLVSALEKMFADQKEREAFSLAAQSFAKQFHPQTIAERWDEIYRQLAPSKPIPKISLIIPAYNEENYIGACLKSVLENSHGKFHEIIVVNNNSKDRTREVAEKFPGVKVVSELDQGLTKARQCGLKESSGDLLAYIDADTTLPPHWLDIAEDFFQKHPHAACLSGPYRYYDGSPWQNKILHTLWWIYAPIAYRLVGYMVLGGNFIASRDALEKIGGFNRSIEFYGEDTDIARRLSRLGEVVFKMNFFIYSSSRRFIAEGIWKTNFNYTMNFIWEVFLHRPFTGQHKDIRLKKDG